MTKARVATIWLDGCSGCHMSLLDIDAAIISLARRMDLVYGPLVDPQEFPEAVDVTLVEGAVSSQEDLNKLQQVRSRSHVLVALGDCAVTGNVPSLRNSIPVNKLLQRVYVEGSDVERLVPSDGVPPLLKHARPVREFVKVDHFLPGCPPPAKSIAALLTALLDGQQDAVVARVKFG